MPDQSPDFMKDYQAFAQQSWESWMRYLQQQPGASAPFGGFNPGSFNPASFNPASFNPGSFNPASFNPASFNPASFNPASFNPGIFNPGSFNPTAASADDLLTRSLSSLQAYGAWLQQAAAAGINPMMNNWQQPTVMQPFLAGFNQPFAQTVAGLDSASAFGLDHQWQSWLQAMQHGGMPGTQQSPMATFGITREMQLDQQTLAAAMHEYAQVNARYQALLQKVNADGISRLQDLLGQHAEPGKQVESLKALYDLWVDAMEEAYAQMALSDEYRGVFGELVNAQMRVRQLQQQQTEQMCRELGMPTRGEVDSLGKRVQQLRRDMRERQRAESSSSESLVDALQAEVADLKRELAATKSKAKEAAAVRPIKPNVSNGKPAEAAAKTPRAASGKRK